MEYKVGEKRQRTKNPKVTKEEEKKEGAPAALSKAQKKRQKRNERINKYKSDDIQAASAKLYTSRKQALGDDGKRAVTAIKGGPDYPYEVDATDHCETSHRAYEDIHQVLELVALELGKTPATL